MYEPQTMIAQLMATMDQINEQIHEVNEFAASHELPVAKVQYPDGRWVMAELALGKAQVLHAMVLMEEQINREVSRQRNEQVYKDELERIVNSDVGIYVYNGRSVNRIGEYSQHDEGWVQAAARTNPDYIYFYAKDK